MFRKTGEMFNLALDQIVLGLPPTDGESDIFIRTGRYLFYINESIFLSFLPLDKIVLGVQIIVQTII